jgi:chaperonin GroEL|tara:strand:- start:1101 stop:2654 length:1554 start_codon:yes stop_codon:yes gene_type:complete
MEYNNPSEIVKTLTFGKEANDQIIAGVEKLANAVKSTLGASGKCVIYEDALGRPVITKDGVTVAESVVLLHPVENIGATLIKQAARNTVREAGDGTTTSTVLANSLLKITNKHLDEEKVRELKAGIISGANKVKVYLDKTSIPVKGQMLQNVAIISCNNDKELGIKIGEAYEKVGKNGVVLMEQSDTNETYVDFVEGVQFDSGLKSTHLITDKDKHTAVLDDPYVLIVSSPIPNIRKIQSVLEYVIKNKRSLLVVADMEQQPYATLLSNKVKGNIKVNIVDVPGFGLTKQDTMDDLALLTGATIINEELGDDLDLISPDVLGSAKKSVTDEKTTILQIDEEIDVTERVAEVTKNIEDESNSFFKKKLEQRLSMLTGKVGIIYVGADSEVELKEKKDRVEDAIHATKAAYKEGIVAGGGVALLNAATSLKASNKGEEILFEAIKSPYYTILDNAGIVEIKKQTIKNRGIDVKTGKEVNMIKAGIIDPVLVTKSALKNAVSVVTTIVSADCVISNKRLM